MFLHTVPLTNGTMFKMDYTLVRRLSAPLQDIPKYCFQLATNNLSFLNSKNVLEVSAGYTLQLAHSKCHSLPSTQ